VTETVRVFVIADIRLYREGLARCLGAEPGIAVVGSAGDGEEAVERLVGADADVVLLDMAAADSLGTARAIRMALPESRVLALAVPDTESHMISCAEAGIAGYVPREGSFPDLVSAVERVARGEGVCSPHVVAGLLRRVADASPEQGAPPLTQRELQSV
jgi:two-component system, NarL family, nitrate/nitrite response regulator NarL